MAGKASPLSLIRRYWRYYGLGGLALVLVNLCDTALPLALKFAIDDIVYARGLVPLWLIAMVYVGLVLMLGVYRYFWRYYFLGASHRIANEVRARLFAHLERLSPSYFQRQRTGDIMSRATNDLEAVRFFFAIGLLLTIDTFMYLLIIPPAMTVLAPQLALYTLLPLLAVPFFVHRMGKVVHARFGRVQDRFGAMAATVEETAGGVRVVKGFAREDHQRGVFRAQNDRFLQENMRLQVAQGLFQPAIAFTMAIALFVVIVIGGRMAVEGTITLGDFVAFQHYLLKLAWPMRAVGMTVNIYQRGLASMGRIDEILSEVPEIRDGPQTLPDARIERGDIEIEGLTFRHPAAPDRPSLEDVRLRIRAGETVALVGPIGAGKSTLLHLLPRLYEVPPETVRIDGVPLERYPVAALREAIGYVPQETFLFADTVAENIAFGCPTVTRAEVLRATESAHIREEIEALPDGFEALLGERGVNLSGGQRQRIAIARAVIRKPKILLLDDCLSAVDTETEAALLRGLRDERAGRTTLISSHRLAAVRDADRIVVLDGGRVVQQGTHDELLARPGLYRTLWERQQLEEAVDAAP